MALDTPEVEKDKSLRRIITGKFQVYFRYTIFSMRRLHEQKRSP